MILFDGQECSLFLFVLSLIPDTFSCISLEDLNIQIDRFCFSIQLLQVFNEITTFLLHFVKLCLKFHFLYDFFYVKNFHFFWDLLLRFLINNRQLDTRVFRHISAQRFCLFNFFYDLLAFFMYKLVCLIVGDILVDQAN